MAFECVLGRARAANLLLIFSSVRHLYQKAICTTGAFEALSGKQASAFEIVQEASDRLEVGVDVTG